MLRQGLLGIIVLFLTMTSILANGTAGKVIIASGDCKINGKLVARGADVNNNDIITTGKNSFLQFRSLDNAITEVKSNSTLIINVLPQQDKGAQTNLVKGALITLSGTAKAPAVTPTTKLAVQGTLYSEKIGQHATRITVYQGNAVCQSKRGERKKLGVEEYRQTALIDSTNNWMWALPINMTPDDSVLQSKTNFDSNGELNQSNEYNNTILETEYKAMDIEEDEETEDAIDNQEQEVIEDEAQDIEEQNIKEQDTEEQDTEE